MSHDFGLQTASGHLTVSAESKEPYPADVEARFRADAAEVIARYPQKRSALLPLLHLVQSVDGYVTGRGIDLCAELLDLSTAEVSGVATFYTQYKRHPNGKYTVGRLHQHAVRGHGRRRDLGRRVRAPRHRPRRDDRRRHDHPRAHRVQRRLRLRPGRHDQLGVLRQPDARLAPSSSSTRCAPARPVAPTRGPKQVCTFKEVSRVLAGFPDGLADEGVGAGPASLVGLRIAHEQGWTAPEGASAASGSDRSAGRTPGRTEVTPDGDEAKADKATTKSAGAPAPDETQEPGAPVASTGDGVSGRGPRGALAEGHRRPGAPAGVRARRRPAAPRTSRPRARRCPADDPAGTKPRRRPKKKGS